MAELTATRYPAPITRSLGCCMRRILNAVTALTLLSAQTALAERRCDTLADQTTFEVQALRSELMVLATGCHEDARYNAFIRRYQPDLQANERAIDIYFKNRYGRAAQTQHDRFVTDLANALSHEGSDLGGDFCPRNGMIFSEVLALDKTGQLADFAAGKNLVPASVEICTAAPATKKTSPVRARKVAEVNNGKHHR
jgi:hypothetical protein